MLNYQRVHRTTTWLKTMTKSHQEVTQGFSASVLSSAAIAIVIDHCPQLCITRCFSTLSTINKHPYDMDITMVIKSTPFQGTIPIIICIYI